MKTKLLKRDAIENADNEVKHTPLHCAVIQNDLAAVMKLIRKGADLDAKTSNGYTPLMIACKTGNFKIVKCFLKASASIDEVDQENNTILHIAARNNFLNVLKFLISEITGNDEENIDDDITKYDCEHVMASWSKYYRIRFKKLILDDEDAKLPRYVFDINRRNRYNENILHVTCSYGYTEMAKYLLDLGKIDTKSRNLFGKLPLHCAAESGNLNIVKYFIEKTNSDANVTDNNKQTLLHASCKAKIESTYFDLVKYLVEEKNLNVNASNMDGETPLHIASKNGKLDLVKYLINKGADINVVTNKGLTPWHFAAGCDRLSTVQYFVEEQNVNINIKDLCGWTPQHYAALFSGNSGKSYKANADMLKYLGEHGADLKAVSNDGDTLLHKAASSSLPNVAKIKYLLTEGLNPNTKNLKNKTPKDMTDINLQWMWR